MDLDSGQSRILESSSSFICGNKGVLIISVEGFSVWEKGDRHVTAGFTQGPCSHACARCTLCRYVCPTKEAIRTLCAASHFPLVCVSTTFKILAVLDIRIKPGDKNLA